MTPPLPIKAESYNWTTREQSLVVSFCPDGSVRLRGVLGELKKAPQRPSWKRCGASFAQTLRFCKKKLDIKIDVQFWYRWRESNPHAIAGNGF